MEYDQMNYPWEKHKYDRFCKYTNERILSEVEFDNQKFFTDPKICLKIVNRKEVIGKIFKNSVKILVVNNIEFVWTLAQLGVDASKIWFITDSKVKTSAVNKLYSKVKLIEESLIDWKNEEELKFDVIIGNPPFQGNSNNGSTGLWSKFVSRSLALLMTNGVLGFVTPKWHGVERKSNGSLICLNIDGNVYNPEERTNLDSFYDYQVEYLELWDVEKAKKYFKEGSSFCWYIIKNKKPTKPTEVKQFLAGKIYNFNCRFRKSEKLPPNITPDIISYFQKLYENGVTKLYTTTECRKDTLERLNSLKSSKDIQHPYEVFRGVGKKSYTSKKSKHYHEYKTLISNTTSPKKSVNVKNQNQTQDFSYKIHSNEFEMRNFYSFLRSDEFSLISEVFRAGKKNFRTDIIPNFDWNIDWKKQWIQPTKKQAGQLNESK